jgi:hypothetical protein
LLLPEPPPASTLIDWPDMGSSQVLFVRKIDSFLRVPLSATGAGDPSPAGLRVADALAGNAPRSSRAKTGVPRPACFCITWPGLDIPAALMGFIQAVLIPTYRPAACFHVAIAAPDFAAAAKTGLFLPADCRHLYNFSAPTVRKPSSTRHFRAKLILSMGVACDWPSLADNARYFCLNLFRRL